MGVFKVRESINCPNCHKEVFYYPDELIGNTVYCESCSAKISLPEAKKEYMTCVSCGEKIEFNRDDISESYVFCQNCGTKNSIKSSDNTSKREVFQSVEAAQDTLEKQDGKPSSPFAEAEDDGELDDEAVMEKIHSCSDNWRESIKDSSNVRSVFTDNFAHGMPEWDLLPPDIAVRRKALRHSSEQRR